MASIVLYASFPHRFEFAAHVVAGAGLAAIALVGVGSAMASIIVVLTVALVAETTFSGPMEVHDVASTVLGGALGVAAVLPVFDPAGAPRADRRRLVAFGLALIVAGVVLRYPMQGFAAKAWWYGS